MIPSEQWDRFIAQIRQTGNVGAACDAANIGRSTFYRRKTDDSAFAADFTDAMESAMDRLEAAAWARAVDGVERITPHGAFREYSDALLITLLKAHRPARYRDTIRQEHSGPDGKPLAPSVIVIPQVNPTDPE